jgi:hypothetical protein
MGKVILEFDSIEEQTEIQDAINGYKWKLAIYDLDQELRNTTKYGYSILKPNTQASEEEVEIAEKYREKIREIINEYGLTFE